MISNLDSGFRAAFVWIMALAVCAYLPSRSTTFSLLSLAALHLSPNLTRSTSSSSSVATFTADFIADPVLPPSCPTRRTFLAKAFIKQAVNEIVPKTEAALPLSDVVLGLLPRGHAALGEVLFARIVKRYPRAMPYYHAQRQGQCRKKYEKSTGRGVDESLGDYIARMGGILALYFAILQSSLSALVPTLPAPPTPDQLAALIPPVLRLLAAWDVSNSSSRPRNTSPLRAEPGAGRREKSAPKRAAIEQAER